MNLEKLSHEIVAASYKIKVDAAGVKLDKVVVKLTKDEDMAEWTELKKKEEKKDAKKK